MAPPRANLLREWAASTSDEKDATSQPVIATLVSKGIQQGNVLFQSAYDQFGHHFSSNGGLETIPSIDANTKANSRCSFDIDLQPSYSSWVYEDEPDQGEVHVINGEAVEMFNVVHDEDDDERYEQAYTNRRRLPRPLRNRGEDSSVGRFRKMFSRGRKGGKELKKGKKPSDNSSSSSGMFPIPIQEKDGKKSTKMWGNRALNQWDGGFAMPSIPLATPCVNLKSQQKQRAARDQMNRVAAANVGAPRKRTMSRAAVNVMKEANIVLQDCEVSELATDIDEDPTRSLHNSLTYTDVDTSKSPDRTFDLELNSAIEHDIHSDTKDESFERFMENAKSVLNHDEDVPFLSNFSPIKDSPATPDRRSTYVKTQSLPNISIDSTLKDSLAVNVGSRIKDYESRVQQINLGTLLQYPASPRKHRRKNASVAPTDENNLNPPPQHLLRTNRKSIGSGISPTKKRTIHDDTHNDTLKVVLIGSPESGKSNIFSSLTQKILNKRDENFHINVGAWKPAVGDDQGVKFNLYDLKGGSLETGMHHSTQSLFFSSHSLYVLVWDMSANKSCNDFHSSDHSLDSDYDSDFEEALQNEKIDQIIQRDIDEHVMYWIDLLSNSNVSNYAVMPVVTFKDQFKESEVNRRCDLLMQRLLELEMGSKSNSPQLLFDANGRIPRVSTVPHSDTIELERCLLGIVHDTSKPAVFQSHFRSKLCAVTISLQNILTGFKKKGLKVIRLEDILVKITENPPSVENFSQSLILDALKFLSDTGFIMYFGASDNTMCTRPHYLEDFVILSPFWLSNALYLALRWEAVSSLIKMNENSSSDASEIGTWRMNQSLPICSRDESLKLWEMHDYVLKASKKLPNMKTRDLYYFLQQICEYSGIFVPFSITTKSGRKQSYYLIPIFAKQVPSEFWTYKVKEHYKTTLCNTFDFSDAVPSSFMDKVAAAIMENVFDFRLQEAAAVVKIQPVHYWKTGIYVKVVEEFEEGNKTIYHATEIFVQLAKNDSPHYINSNGSSSQSRKLIVSAKGYEGNFGDKIWNLGFNTVLESIERVADIHAKGSLSREIVCPGCLLKTKACKAIVWNSDEINYGDDGVLCSNGHEVDPRLLLGPCEHIDDGASVATAANSVYSSFSAYSAQSNYTNATNQSYRNPDVMIPAVVIVALWDRKNKRILKIGSGFIADNKMGLIVTAAHTLFNFDGDESYGKLTEEFLGLEDTTALIGINQKGDDSAIFTYSADIVAFDVYNVDGCVLQIKSKFERPVELDRTYLPVRAEFPLSSRYEVKNERLQRLKMTTTSSRQQQVRVLGFRQTGEGILVEGSHINRTACVNVGYVCKPSKSNWHQSGEEFVPRSEIVVSCDTANGNSGGPFVNELGQVIGILSRTDPIENSRCYLTPSSELKILLKQARRRCTSSSPFLENDFGNICL